MSITNDLDFTIGKMIQPFFKAIEPSLIKFYKKITAPPAPNLEGDRVLEYSWIAARIPQGPGNALEFASAGPGYLSLIAAEKSFTVTSLDQLPIEVFYSHQNIKFIKQDIFHTNFPPQSFDLIINCSGIEHVGLGRYKDRKDKKGDIKAMQILKNFLKPKGIMLLTIPVGKDAVILPFHRIYGEKRLPKLLNGYRIKEEAHWVKNKHNLWVNSAKKEALNQKGSSVYYSIGCFVLEKNYA